MKYSEKSEYLILLYIAFFVVFNFTGVSFLSDIAWAPYITSQSNPDAPQGSAWVQESNLHWTDGSQEHWVDTTPEGINGYWEFDRGTGTTAYDSSGNTKDVAINGATWASGRFGNALDFDGTDDYVDIPAYSGSVNLEERRLRTDFTYTLWFKTTDSDAGLFGVQGGNDPSNADGHDRHIYLNGGDVCVRVYNDGGNNGNPCVTGSFADGNWHHVAFRTVENDATYVYVDGTNVASDTDASVSDFSGSAGGWSNLYAMVGRSNDASNQYGNSVIDDLRIYDRPLKPSEIEKLANGNTNLPPTSLKANLRMDSGSGSTAVDSSAKGNDGSISGATWANGKFSNALDFDGTDDYVEVSDDSSLDIQNEITVSAWVRIDSKPNTQPRIVSKTPTNDAYLLWNSDDSGNVDEYGFRLQLTGSGRTTVYSEGRTYSGNWEHVVGTYDGSELRIYINGELINSISGSGNIETTTGNLLVGGESSSVIDGGVDEVKIYSRALSPDEIQQLYEGVGSQSSGPLGSWWISGNDMRWVDENGIKRGYNGVLSEVAEIYDTTLGQDGNGNTISAGLDTEKRLDNIYGHSGSQLSFDEGGKYIIHYGVSWRSSSAGGRHIMKNWLRKNGGSTITPSETRCYIRHSGAGDSCSNSGSVMVNVNPGDYIELIGTKDHGTTGNTITEEDVYMYAEKVEDRDVAQIYDSDGGQNYDGSTITVDMDRMTNVDSAYSFNSGSSSVTAEESGWYKVYHSVNNHDTGQGDRQTVKSWITSSGSISNPLDSYSYIRNTGDGDQNHQTGVGLVNLNAGDNIQVRQQKVYQQSSGSSVTLPNSWLMMEQVDHSDILQVRESAGGQSLSHGETAAITFDTNDVVGSSYSHSTGTSTITIEESGWYDVSYNVALDDGGGTNADRRRYRAWLRENGGTTLRPSEQRSYGRGYEGGRLNSMSSNTAHYFESGDTIELMVSHTTDDGGGTAQIISNSAYMTITPLAGGSEKSPGKAWMESGNVHYVDESNDERKVPASKSETGDLIWKHDFSNGMPPEFDHDASYPNSGTWGRQHDLSGGNVYEPASINGEYLRNWAGDCSYQGQSYPTHLDPDLSNWMIHYRVQPDGYQRTSHDQRETGGIGTGAVPRGNYNDDMTQLGYAQVGWIDYGSNIRVRYINSTGDANIIEEASSFDNTQEWHVKIASTPSNTRVKYWQVGNSEPDSWQHTFNVDISGRPGFYSKGTCKGDSRYNDYAFYRLYEYYE